VLTIESTLGGGANGVGLRPESAIPLLGSAEIRRQRAGRPVQSVW